MLNIFQDSPHQYRANFLQIIFTIIFGLQSETVGQPGLHEIIQNFAPASHSDEEHLSFPSVLSNSPQGSEYHYSIDRPSPYAQNGIST